MIAAPVDPPDHLDAFRLNYDSGDVLALFQAVRYAKEEDLALPKWAIVPLEDLLRAVVLDRPGKVGRGNRPLGHLHKAYLRCVRASTYLYIREWQACPHRYHNLPVWLWNGWYNDEPTWEMSRSVADAQRLASFCIDGTDFDAKASTVRKAAYGMRRPVPLRRWDVEEDLGLRGPNCIFGRPDFGMSAKVKKLLATRPPKT